MIRWPIQIAALPFYAAAFVFCWRLYRSRVRDYSYLGPVLVWLAGEVVLAAALTSRVIRFGGEPPLSLAMNWWANVLWLAGAICLILTFWLSRRGHG